MIVKPFPLCCGAFIINDFGNTNESMGTEDIVPEKDVAAFLETAKKRYGGAAFLIAILNEQQKDALGKTFEKAGFSLVQDGLTSSYGYNLSMFVHSNDPKNPGKYDEDEDDLDGYD